MSKVLIQKADFFKALSDPTRLALVARLACSDQPQTVTEVSSCCGVHLSGVSRHLAALRAAGLVRIERRGREALYTLEREALTGMLREFAEALKGCCQ